MSDKSAKWDWKWENNPKQVTWAKWLPGYPTRLKDDCVMLGDDGLVDTVCFEEKNAVCEKENTGLNDLNCTFMTCLFL